MLGTACFRFCTRGSYCPTTGAVTHFYHCSPHPYSTQVICRHATSLSFSRNLSWPRQQAANVNTEDGILQVASSVKRFCCHTSSCLLGGNEISCATIWHGLLPSHHPSILDENVVSSFNNSCSFSNFEPLLGSMPRSSLNFPCKDQGRTGSSISAVGVLPSSINSVKYAAGLSFPHGTVGGMGRFAMASGLSDGSWNVAWDARPARWLHGRHSAWLLFGVCACVSAAAGPSPNSLVHVEGVLEHLGSSQTESECEAIVSKATQAKQAYTDYSVTGIPGDGRCLFRAVAHGACLRSGKEPPSETVQRELADDLRQKVVDELISRRAESEWFIEEDFDTYVKRMRDPYVWGGEPELLMASHVLKMPIAVHLFDRTSGGLISIAEYGMEYGSEDPIRVLYHGFGHYDAVEIPGVGAQSKL